MPPVPQPGPSAGSGQSNHVVGMIVAIAALVALAVIVAVSLLLLPDDDTKGQNVVAIATSSFGVIGAVTGAYFGIRTANNAVDQLGE